MRVILNNQSKAMWTTEDIAKAIALRAKSSRAYSHMRTVFNYPLPGISTLQKYISKIDFTPGVLHSVMNLLKHEFMDYSDVQRQAVLSFDEMSLESEYCYNPREDKIYGQESNLTVAVIRGLFSCWKQPVFYDFQKMTVDKLNTIMTECYRIGIHVRAIVSDLGGKNRGIWKEIGISKEKTFSKHPCDNSNVWWFADVPHLIKLIRNNILDYGLTLSTQCKISKSDFEQLMKTDNGEFRLQFKVSDYHINLKGRERMRVRPACQLLSRRT